MLRQSYVALASKISGGHARNQAGAPRKKFKQFHVFLNAPVSTQEPIREQRHRFGQDVFSRDPDYRPGKNVRIDGRFTLHAKTKGVVTLRKSRINPEYKWVDVEPDIQKVRRARELRRELALRSETTEMVEANEAYRPELDIMREPQWRERVMSVKKATDRFIDPNLFSRGVVQELKPKDRYCYE